MFQSYRPLLTAALISLVQLTQGQHSCGPLFHHSNDTVYEWQNRLQQRNRAEVQAFTGALAEQKKWLYDEKLKSAMEHFSKPELITDTAVNRYLSAVMLKLEPAVKSLKAPGINVYLSRSGVPNAFTPGYNTIFINAGLFTRIQNEAQLAFVLCHEMAHLFLNHSEEAADQYLSSIQSPEFKKKVAAIKKQEFGRGRAIEELFKKFSFDFRKHNRFKETAADSLAIVWLLQTAYNPGQVMDCLSILDRVDADICNTKQVFEKYLSTAAYPVNPGYFGTTRRSVFGVAAYTDDAETQQLKDSLKTHPDCKQRIAYAGQLIPEAVRHTGSTFLTDTALFYNLQQRLHNEIIEFALYNEKTSLALFYAIEQLNADDQYPFAAAGISRALLQLYDAQKEHTLGKRADLPNPQLYTKSYNELLYFIQHATLADLLQINYHFTASALQKYPHCKELASSMAECAGKLGKTEEATYWKNKF